MKTTTYAELVQEYDSAVNSFCEGIGIEPQTDADYTIKNMRPYEIFECGEGANWEDEVTKDYIFTNAYQSILTRIEEITVEEINRAKGSVEPLVGEVIIKYGDWKLIEINAPGEESIHIITNNGISKHIVTDGFKEALLLFASAI